MMVVASQMRWPEQDHAGLWASEIYSVSSGARMMLKEACVLHMRELACGKTLGKCLVLEE